MKKLLLIAGALALLTWGGVAAYRSLASVETRVRWLLDDAARAFNDGRVTAFLRCFAADYRDTTVDVDAATLERALLASVARRLPRSGRNILRVDVPAAEVRVEVTPSNDRARVTFVVHLFDGDPTVPTWAAAVDATAAEVDGAWRFVRSSHTTLAGRRPSR